MAVQYPGDPGLWDNLEELLAYINCAEGPEATLAKINFHCCCCKLLFFNVGRLTEHCSELLFSNFVLPRTYVNMA